MRLNPVAKIRKSLGMYQNGLAEACGLSTSAIYYVEKGQFVTIPGKIHEYFTKRIEGYYSNDIDRDYNRWIKEKRFYNQQSVRPVIVDEKSIFPDNIWDLTKHPLQFYLDYWEMNASKFCDLVCIPKNSFYTYVKGAQEDMPSIIYQALKDCGMSEPQVELLDRMGSLFYRYTEKARMTERRANGRIRN